MIKKSKTISIGKLKKRAASVFQRWAAKRNSNDGWGICVTCYAFKKTAELQGGHFIQGRHNSVLFDERNCHPQCVGCNIFKRGNLIPYYEFMEKTYGKEVIEELKTLQRETRSFTRTELLEIIKKYSEGV